jgi:hypothetical protein
MVITSTTFFNAIREYDWKQLLEWINSKETVSYPEQTEWRLDDDVIQSQPRTNPADIVEYIYFGTTKGGLGGYMTFFNKPKSSVKALFYAKSSGYCVTFNTDLLNTDLQDFYSTYFVLLQHRGAPISIDGKIQIPGCTIPEDVKTVLIDIDNYFNYLKRYGTKNRNIFNKFEDYLDPDLKNLLKNGGFRRSRKARKTRKTRKSLHK